VSESKCQVIAADKISRSGLTPLTSDSRFEIEMADDWDEAQLIESLKTAHGLIVRSKTKVTKELIDCAPNLKVIGRAGVGVDNIDLDAATERGIPVINAPAGNTVSAAELTMTLILAVARKVAGADRSVRSGEWARSQFAGSELRGKTLALIGAGRIGGEVAKRAQAFGMRTLVFDPYLTSERAEELGLERVSFEDALAWGDVLTLHVPLTPATEGMIGAEQLEAMKSSAFLINVARGGVVDEAALVAALEAGSIAGAALDVYATEPLPEESTLRSAPNLVLTPHLGASTAEAQELVATEIAEGVRDALMEGDLSKALNAPAIGGEALEQVRALLDLAKRVGQISGWLARGGLRKVEVRVAGAPEAGLQPLTASALAGTLERALGVDQVNYVNAHHLAEVRGVEVVSTTITGRSNYSQYVEVIVEAENRSVSVAGALLGEQNHPRIVKIDGFRLSIEPVGTLLVMRNQDVPGVIGAVGQLLATNDLNIAQYAQARIDTAGEALACAVVDGWVPSELREEMRALESVLDLRVVRLDQV
jgi:D-3-phosphoglycerate dehydrogenase / 2-oxoglutarate reductase